MKKVFNTSDQVIHLFAQKSQSEARCTNVFMERESNFKGDYANLLYSYGYHYELARFLDEKTVLINDKGYSSTTSRHISSAKYALRQYTVYLKTQTDLKLVLESMQDNYKKWIVARKPEIYVNNITVLWKSLNKYITDRKIKCKNKPEYREIKKIFDSVNYGNTEILENFRKNKAKSEAKRIKKILNDKLQKFLNYEIDTLRIGQKEDFLRISKCGKYIETSQNVRVSKESGKALYQLIKKGIDVKGYIIDGYTVTSINGTLKIGCHDINIKSVYEIGEKL